MFKSVKRLKRPTRSKRSSPSNGSDEKLFRVQGSRVQSDFCEELNFDPFMPLRRR